ncbi:CHAT domain-containing protein [Laspinema olomoucense]|uniref:CHAT domain-containing protein n=1 Tax=Laspinema olomoucense D3b TaxID=2953688 RepID=A0ABT2NBK3_9CYAN|nr:CHAT domain-containing protein [Laspinema sp. D3b]MCT7980083.1 CHAT domain-containing protein [Laspinema sp. D3b]
MTATRLLQWLADLNGPKGLPHFTFLCSCETASPDAEAGLGGLGQRLVRELGMPGAIAMSEPVTVKTALALTSRFYPQLRQSGQVDLVLCEATAGLAERDDITVPALFSRLGDRPLFSDNLDRDLTSAEIEEGLKSLQTLLQERSPVVIPEFQAQKAILERSLGAEAVVLNSQARQERYQALGEINTLCDRSRGGVVVALRGISRTRGSESGDRPNGGPSISQFIPNGTNSGSEYLCALNPFR